MLFGLTRMSVATGARPGGVAKLESTLEDLRVDRNRLRRLLGGPGGGLSLGRRRVDRRHHHRQEVRRACSAVPAAGAIDPAAAGGCLSDRAAALLGGGNFGLTPEIAKGIGNSWGSAGF